MRDRSQVEIKIESLSRATDRPGSMLILPKLSLWMEPIITEDLEASLVTRIRVTSGPMAILKLPYKVPVTKSPS